MDDVFPPNPMTYLRAFTGTDLASLARTAQGFAGTPVDDPAYAGWTYRTIMSATSVAFVANGQNAFGLTVVYEITQATDEHP